MGNDSAMSAWDSVHINDLKARRFELYGPYYQISDAEAETLVSVYGTAQDASFALPHIPAQMITERMADIIRQREHAEEDTND